MVSGVGVFDLIGINGFRAVVDIFLTPLLNPLKWQDVALKAAPLVIIALGLSVGNRAQIWNIGAEGQYVVGALCAAGIGIAAGTAGGPIILTAMIAAGIIGGAAYGFIPAILRTRYNVNEILSSLMLTYVSYQILGCLLYTSCWRNIFALSAGNIIPFNLSRPCYISMRPPRESLLRLHLSLIHI